MTTAVVFAGQSFVGRPIAALLRRLGARVAVTARNAGSGNDTVACDLTDRAAVDALLATWKPDWVVQCAGATRTTDPWQLYALHVQGTLGLLSAVARHVPRSVVVLFGSAAEYGQVPPECLPIREDQPPHPLTLFAASKLAQTHLAAAFAREHRLRVVTVRPFNILGPGLPEHYFAAALAQRLRRLRLTGTPGPIPVANLHATRDFIDVRDVAEAVAAILTRYPIDPGQMQTCNVASGVETALIEVAAYLGRLAGGFEPVAGGDESSRGGAQRSRGDATRLRQATGWLPRWTWQQSVAEMWASCSPSPLVGEPLLALRASSEGAGG